MTSLDSVLKSRDITLPTKACLVKAVVFPVVMYTRESWTIKKAERWKDDAFELGVNSGRLLHGSVGTGVGLGQTEGADPLARSELGQIFHLLLLGTVLQDGSHAQRGVGREDNASGCTHA